MSAIARIELYHVAVPLPARFYPSWIPGFPQTENRFTLIKVVTEEGVEGYSAGPALARERARPFSPDSRTACASPISAGTPNRS